MPASPLYDPERDRSFSAERCFLCGDFITEGNETKEHIFPKWILNEFDLWNDKLTLLNETSIPYKIFTIPCCQSCNNQHLSVLENSIKDNYLKGHKKFVSIDFKSLFLWLSKIFYGILFKEILLPYDRSNPHIDRAILNIDIFERFSNLHLFLQGIRKSINFQGGVPWSIFIFKTQVTDNIKLNFDFKDSIIDLTLMLRLGEIGIIAVLQDGGLQANNFNDIIQPYQQIQLHPLQLIELFSKISYKQRLLARYPKYLTVNDETDINVVLMPMGGFSIKPVYEVWDQASYAVHLSNYTQIPFDQIFHPPDLVMTFLRNDDGSLKIINTDPNFVPTTGN